MPRHLLSSLLLALTSGALCLGGVLPGQAGPSTGQANGAGHDGKSTGLSGSAGRDRPSTGQRDGAGQEPTAETANAPAGLRRFTSRSRTFHIDLPADWRQLAPTETERLRATVPGLPLDILRNEPRMFYPVGPVDRWLAGGFDGTYLYVLEQGNEWQAGDADAELTRRLQEMWDEKGRIDGIRHTITDLQHTTIGSEAFPVWRCERTSVRLEDDRTERRIDVYAPTGGRQVSLSFTCLAADFPRRQPAFEAMIQSLTLARRPRGEQTLQDRLWTPLIVGAVIGIVLILLYRHTRRRPTLPTGPGS